jgi:hypothetical protein
MEIIGAWLLVAFVFAVLAAFWWMLNLTFDLIERTHKRLREGGELE